MFEDNFQSYFGESDSDFFGDTSNDMIFGEGYGEQAVDSSQFFTEATGFSTEGGEFISEATAFDTTTGDYFTEGGITYAGTPGIRPEDNPVLKERAKLRRNSTGGKRFGDMAEADSRAQIDSEDKHYGDVTTKGSVPSYKARDNSTYVTPEHIENSRSALARGRRSEAQYRANPTHKNAIKASDDLVRAGQASLSKFKAQSHAKGIGNTLEKYSDKS